MKSRTDIEAMTDEERRIATAELVGWKCQEGEEPRYGGTFKQAAWISPKGSIRHIAWQEKTVVGLPDYLGSLDACHEAESILPEEACVGAFVDALISVCQNGHLCDRDGDYDYPACFGFAHATARQRNTAFLMVLL